MLQLLPCPHCGHQSLLPHDTSLEASLKCPHCGQAIVLGEALLEQFSSWEVVSDPAASVPIEPSISQLTQRPVVIAVPQADPMQEELELADSADQVSTPATPSVSVRPYTHFEYERMRRKEKSPIWSIIPVILGGLAAFPIALLILWWGLGKDVGDLGPKIAAYAPWIVPQQFHPVENLPVLSRRKAVPRSGEGGLPQVGETTTSPIKKKIAAESESVQPSMDPKSDKSVVEKREMAAPDGPTVKPTLPTESSEDGDLDNTSQPLNQNLFLSIRESKELLAALVKALEPTATESEQLTPARQKEVFLLAYERLASVATFCSQIEKDNPVHKVIREQMQPIARMIQQSTQFQSAFDNVTKGRATGKPENVFSGIAMTLKNIEVERQLDFWIVTGDHQLAEQTTIEIPRALAPNLVSGQGLFVLGVVVQNISDSGPATPKLRVSYLHSL